jgi:hypothetical protein
MMFPLLLALAAVAPLTVRTPQGGLLTYTGPAVIDPRAAELVDREHALARMNLMRTTRPTWLTFVLTVPPDSAFCWPDSQAVVATLSTGKLAIAFEQFAVLAKDGRAVDLAWGAPVRLPPGVLRRRQVGDAEGYIILAAFPRDLTGVTLTHLYIGRRAMQMCITPRPTSH